MTDPTTDPALETLSVSEAAAVLRVSPNHVRRLAAKREMPGAFRLGTRILINKARLLAWIKAQGQRPTPLRRVA